MGKTQNHLILKSTQLWEGPSDPELAPPLAQIGLDESNLEKFKTQTLEYTTAKHQCAALLSKQKASTVLKKQALREVERQFIDLTSLFRLLYRHSSFRSMLNMSASSRESAETSALENGVSVEGQETGDSGQAEEPEASQVRGRRSMAQASIRGRLTQALANIERLPQEEKDTLADYGWGEERIAGAREKLEAYKVSFAENKKQVGLYRQHVKETETKRRALEQKYRALSLQIRRNLDRFEVNGERLRNIAVTL